MALEPTFKLPQKQLESLKQLVKLQRSPREPPETCLGPWRRDIYGRLCGRRLARVRTSGFGYCFGRSGLTAMSWLYIPTGALGLT